MFHLCRWHSSRHFHNVCLYNMAVKPAAHLCILLEKENWDIRRHKCRGQDGPTMVCQVPHPSYAVTARPPYLEPFPGDLGKAIKRLKLKTLARKGSLSVRLGKHTLKDQWAPVGLLAFSSASRVTSLNLYSYTSNTEIACVLRWGCDPASSHSV